MAERKPRRSKPRALQAVRSQTEIEQLLDALDEAIIAGDRAQAERQMGQIWQARRQMPDVLTERLINGRARVPIFAFELLGGFAGARAGTYLRRVAEDRRAPDIVRFGAQRRAGWPERGAAKRRLAFLVTLQDPEGTLVVAIDQGTMTWPPDNDILQEILGYLTVLPSEQRRAVVARAVHDLGLRTTWLLHTLLHSDDPATQRLALNELVRLREPGAAGPIGRLAKTTPDAELKVDATAAIRRLSLQVVDRGEPIELPPLPPLERAALSPIDGDGGQMLLVARRLGEGVFLMTHFLLKDDWGIKDALGTSKMPADQLEAILSKFDEEGVELVEIDLAAVRGALDSTVEVNAATGHGIPPVFEIWEPLVHEAYPPPADEPVTVPELDDAPYAGRQDLLRGSERLLDHAFLESWAFDPTAMSTAMAAVAPPRSGRLGDRQYRAIIEQLLAPPMQARLRQRLRRQAWVLEKTGATAERDLALAVAAASANTGPAELAKLPFWRMLVDRSLAALIGSILFGPSPGTPAK